MAWLAQAAVPPWGDTPLALETTQVCASPLPVLTQRLYGLEGCQPSSPGAGVGVPNTSAPGPGVKHSSSSTADLASCAQLSN